MVGDERRSIWGEQGLKRLDREKTYLRESFLSSRQRPPKQRVCEAVNPYAVARVNDRRKKSPTDATPEPTRRVGIRDGATARSGRPRQRRPRGPGKPLSSVGTDENLERNNACDMQRIHMPVCRQTRRRNQATPAVSTRYKGGKVYVVRPAD